MELPDIVERWIDVQTGTFDLDRYLDLFTEDVTFRDGETGKTIHGKQNLAEFVQPFTQLCELSPNVLVYAVNGNTVFVEGELKGKAPTGARMTARGVGVFAMTGEKISSFAMYMFRRNIAV